MRITLALFTATLVSAPLAAQAPTDADGRPFFLRQAEPPSVALQAYREKPYRPIRAAEVHSAGFLTEEELFSFGESIGAVQPNGGRSTGSPAVSGLGSEFAVMAPEGASYAVGDTLIVATVSAGPRGWGDRVIPTGMLVVSRSNGRDADTRVVAIYGALRGSQAVYRAEAIADPGMVKPVATPSGPEGAVIDARELRELLVPTGHIYSDLGQRDGIKLGDFVEVRHESTGDLAADSAAEPMATGQVVHVRPNSSTIKLMNVLAPHIRSGAPVVRVATLP